MQAGLAPHAFMLEVSLPQSAYLDILCMSCLHLVNGVVQNLIHLQQGSANVSSHIDVSLNCSSQQSTAADPQTVSQCSTMTGLFRLEWNPLSRHTQSCRGSQVTTQPPHQQRNTATQMQIGPQRPCACPCKCWLPDHLHAPVPSIAEFSDFSQHQS